MTTGQKIRELRLAAKLTQDQCAIRMGVVQSRWADIESDRHDATVGMLYRVAMVLGCTVEVIWK